MIENERVELAIDYLVHEFCKLFPYLGRECIREKIESQAPNSESEDKIIEDFWNLFEAICHCWKQKNLTSIVTDANMKWKKIRAPIIKLRCETPQGWAENFPPFPVVGAIEYLKDNQQILTEAIQTTKQICLDRDDHDLEDPLIGVFIENNDILVNDGNRRVITKIVQLAQEENPDLEERLSIWVGQRLGTAEGSWIPTVFAKKSKELTHP
ncbi:MAG TPA: hypothetical protein VKK79_22890 [Candidatus Lokiarchaeia archaeon]|nr:hypothetical protein [Candidatus Lokiarchaeia archaeon]